MVFRDELVEFESRRGIWNGIANQKHDATFLSDSLKCVCVHRLGSFQGLRE